MRNSVVDPPHNAEHLLSCFSYKKMPKNEKTGLIKKKDKPTTQQKSTQCTNPISENIQFFFLLFGVVVTGGLNRVASKIVTVPMGEFSFFLSFFNAIVYVVMYWCILGVKFAVGGVSKEDFLYIWKPEKGSFCLHSPLKYFVAIGLLDGLTNVLSLVASPYLPGTLIALLSQTNVVFSLFAAITILHAKYTFWQIWAVFLLLSGVTATLMPEFGDIQLLEPNIHYSLVMGFSTLPQAVSVTLKELLFSQKPDFDIFFINAHGSLFQLLLTPFFLPIGLLFDQTGGKPFGTYITDGFKCFVGITPVGFGVDCGPDPYPYICYITVNLIFNVGILILVKRASAVLSFMAIQAVLPLSVVLFYFNWPFLGPTLPSPWTLGGLVVVLVALGIFQFFSIEKKNNQLPCLSLSLPRLEAMCDVEDIVVQ